VMAETLTKSLAQIFGREVEKALAPDQLASTATSVIPTAGLPIDPEQTAPSAAAGDLTALAVEAQTHLDNAEKAQRAGDWALYGEELRKVRDVLERMQRAK
jgi:uncharacterized membrane protein (UPF0182 family)